MVRVLGTDPPKLWGDCVPFAALVVSALVYGVSAVLPVSAATHALLLETALGWPAPAPGVAAAMNLGVALALATVLGSDLWRMAAGLVQAAKRRRDPGAKLVLHLTIASAPLIAAGLGMAQAGETGAPLDLATAGVVSIAFGVLLYLTDRIGMTIRRVEHMGAKGALALGLFQLLALVPGAGRMGASVVGARILGYERVEAARVALLMGIPVTLALAGDAAGRAEGFGSDALIAGGLAFLAAMAGASTILASMKRGRFTSFAGYRVVLGAAILAWLYLPLPA